MMNLPPFDINKNNNKWPLEPGGCCVAGRNPLLGALLAVGQQPPGRARPHCSQAAAGRRSRRGLAKPESRALVVPVAGRAEPIIN